MPQQIEITGLFNSRATLSDAINVSIEADLLDKLKETYSYLKEKYGRDLVKFKDGVLTFDCAMAEIIEEESI